VSATAAERGERFGSRHAARVERAKNLSLLRLSTIRPVGHHFRIGACEQLGLGLHKCVLVMEFLLEPLSYGFMVRALLVSALVGGVCGLLSCFMTLKGWALMGDAVSHAVLPGVVIAYGLGLPLSLGAFVFGVGSVAAIGFVKQMSRVKEDTVIGLVFTGFFALGLVLNSKTLSDIDLHHILIGNVLGIQGAEIVQICLISGIVLLFLLIFFRDLMLFCFDPTHARSIGINTGMLHYMLLGLLSLAAVAGLQTVGIILVVAMLVTPGATAYLLTDRFDRMAVIAVISSMSSCLLGVLISFRTDSSPAGCIVLTQTVQFLLAFLLAPRHGVLRRQSNLST
jgi:manganese transport system permease protein